MGMALGFSSPVLNVVTTQLTPPKVGSVASANTIAGLFDDFINIVNTGSGAETIVYPTLTTVSQSLKDASQTLVNLKSTVQKNTIDFIISMCNISTALFTLD